MTSIIGPVVVGIVLGCIVILIRILDKPKVMTDTDGKVRATPVSARGDEPKSALEKMAEGWNKIRANMRFLYPVFVLVPYYLTAIVLYHYKSVLWEPWPKNRLLFFVLIPVALLIPVGIRVTTPPEKKGRRKLPLALSFVFLGSLVYFALEKYSETEWGSRYVARLEDSYDRHLATKAEATKPPRWLWTNTVPTGVKLKRGAEHSSASPPYVARILADDDVLFEFVYFYPHSFEAKLQVAHFRWPKASDPLKGTWSKVNPPDKGEWYLAPNGAGNGYVGWFTSEDAGGDKIVMWLYQDPAK